MTGGASSALSHLYWPRLFFPRSDYVREEGGNAVGCTSAGVVAPSGRSTVYCSFYGVVGPLFIVGIVTSSM